MNRSPLTYLAVTTAMLIARAHAEPLADILARMDRDAPAFKAMTAKIKQVEYTEAFHDTDISEGEVRLRRGKNGSVMLFDYQKPDKYTVQIDSKEFRKYFPNAHEVQIIQLGRLTGKLKVDQLLLTGFGSSGAELKKDYTISDGGSSTVSGKPATRIDLIPKSGEVLKYVVKIELWIPEGQSNAVQVKLTEPSKNYKLVTYSEVKSNPALPDSAFQLNVPPGTKTTNLK